MSETRTATRALSGVSCPGLIEAGALASPAPSPRRAYPGFLAPASLKLTSKGRQRDDSGPYPGFLAPASLKHENLPAHSPPVGILSGVSCPGLIEASSTAPRRAFRALLIRGFLPRPH